MYTTPRKVKQESRLRRSLSLTNNNNGNGSNRMTSAGCAQSNPYIFYFRVNKCLLNDPILLCTMIRNLGSILLALLLINLVYLLPKLTIYRNFISALLNNNTA